MTLRPALADSGIVFRRTDLPHGEDIPARADNVDVTFAATHPLENTGVIILEGSPTDGWKALSWEGATVEPAGEGGPAGEALGATG